ncbi:MAG: TonB-dependent receptor [Magnetospirillum sp. WYHS-4]
MADHFWRWLSQGVAIGIGFSPACLTTIAQPASAADSFIDTRGQVHHFGNELPPIPSYADIAIAPSVFSYRRDSVPAYDPWSAAVGRPVNGVATLGGFESQANILTVGLRADATRGASRVGAAARGEKAHAYEDGAGRRTPHNYRRNTEYLDLGHGEAKDGALSLHAFRDRMDDFRIPSYGVDGDIIERDYGRLSFDKTGLSGPLATVTAGMSFTNVHVVADNFRLRTPGSLQLEYVLDYQEAKFDVLATRPDFGGTTSLGYDLSWGRHVYMMYNREMGPSVVTSYRIPDVETLRTGLSLGHRRDLAGTDVQGALRYDVVAKDPQDVHNRPRATGSQDLYNLSAQELYDRYYGPGQDTYRIEHDLSARLRAERPVGPTQSFVDIKRFVRMAGDGERYLGNSGGVATLQVGNPGLDSEKHYTAELGTAATGGGYKGYGLASPVGAWRVAGSASHDHVEDFITADRARGQSGIRLADNAIVYRNVTAEIGRLEADLQAMVAEGWGVRLNLAGSRGRNTSDERPLYGVPPLEANLFLDTFGGSPEEGWNLGTRLRAVLPRGGVDDSTATGAGIDRAGKGDGFATLDVYGGWRPLPGLALRAGIDNLLDRTYHEHIQPAPQTPTSQWAYAPGRSWFLRLVASF